MNTPPPSSQAAPVKKKDLVLEYWKKGTIKVFANGREQELSLPDFAYIIQRINETRDDE